MTSIAALLAWLLQFPAWFQLTEHARLLLHEILRVLVRPDSFTAADLRYLERSLQIAEACAERAVWLLAITMMTPGSRPPVRRPAPFRYTPSRTPPTLDALLWRALQLRIRIDAIHESARRALRTMVRSGETHAHTTPRFHSDCMPRIAPNQRAHAPSGRPPSGCSQTGPPAILTT